jgi:hypothetical protein
VIDLSVVPRHDFFNFIQHPVLHVGIFGKRVAERGQGVGNFIESGNKETDALGGDDVIS